MSYDGIVTKAMALQLKDQLTMGKIEKIYQPQPEQLLFVIHTTSGKKRLFMSASGSHSAVYLVDETPENPINPPSFCMVLRKHLNAARITDILRHEDDRIIEILFETVNEMGFNVNRKLIVEIMGKHSNILLLAMPEGKIIDSIKHVGIDVNRARQILPGKLYEYPPAQNKIPFSRVTEEDMDRITRDQLQPERSILDSIQGISPPLASSIAGEGAFAALQEINRSLEERDFTPVVYKNDKGIPADFHITRLAVYENDPGYERIEFTDLSRACSYFFSNRESSNTIKQKAGDLLRHIKGHSDKLKLKVQRLQEDIIKAEKADKYRLYGELLTASLHSIKPGSSEASVTNYYTGEPITIPLDPRFSPAKNAQRYFKKYAKAKTALKEKALQLDETRAGIDYLESVVTFINSARSIEELNMIREELEETGYLRHRKKDNRKKKEKPKPYEYRTSSGKLVLAGRNNKENDWLTFKKASSTDYWFHTKDIPGSHVILFTEGSDPTEDEIFETAAIAAHHSKASASENVPVDYVKVRLVKKPSGSNPGFVIFTGNRTVYVTPKLPH
ncbi:MAG: NFACT family protein [Clostridiales bacterium]|nr:NFACT family protein [Clostridiales bacterium]MDD7035425.1 NFACT RNA binding domain-containing protein [Bacillota bacterium]MDY2919999.1 NFACT RNA binding domain-containing protein [Lentihominibacter sp.]